MTSPITPDTTLAELVDAWLNDLRIERRLETTTINEYERVLRKLVVPTLGGHRLAALRTDGIDAVLADLGTQSVNRQRKAKVVTGAMLDASVALGASASNPVRGSMPVRRPKSEPRALSPAEVERIRTAVRACTAKIVPVRSRRATSPTSFSSCSAPGARIGEVLALRWSDIDLEARTVEINGTIKTETAKGTYRKPLATPRTVGLTALAIDVLCRRQQSGGRKRCGRDLRDEERHLAPGQQRRATLAPGSHRSRARVDDAARLPRAGAMTSYATSPTPWSPSTEARSCSSPAAAGIARSVPSGSSGRRVRSS